jgi:hypothetical protein
MAASSSSSSVPTLLETMSEVCTINLGRTIDLQPASGGGSGGGSGASISVAVDKHTADKYFIKTASLASGGKMLHAEYEGVKAMAETNTIKVPNPIAFGEFHVKPSNCAFVVFEYLQFTGGGSGYELGQNLAKVRDADLNNNYVCTCKKYKISLKRKYQIQLYIQRCTDASVLTNCLVGKTPFP